MTLEDDLTYDDGTDTCYELVNGELVAMPPESPLNKQIVSFLFASFLRAEIPHYCLSIGIQVAVSGAWATARRPDLVVLSDEAIAALDGTAPSVITHDMLLPWLVVEVVNPKQAHRDYRHKRTEYAGRRIPEYLSIGS